MQELPKGEAEGYSAMIRYQALLKKNVLFPSISLAVHISWIKQIFFNTEFFVPRAHIGSMISTLTSHRSLSNIKSYLHCYSGEGRKLFQTKVFSLAIPHYIPTSLFEQIFNRCPD